MEILKSWAHNGKRPLFYYYRDTLRREVDLLIREGTTYHPVEIKMTSSPKASMAQSFELIRGSGLTRGPGTIVCDCDEPRYLASHLTAMSVWDL